jgi:hypothetical protein
MFWHRNGLVQVGPTLRIKGGSVVANEFQEFFPENLQEDQIPKLDQALQLNEPLLLGCYLKEELREPWNQPSRDDMEAFMKDWCEKAEQTAIGQLMKMATTLRTHVSGI